jgi:hypothetical protein
MGAELAGLELAKGTAGVGRPPLGGRPDLPPNSTSAPTLAEIGITKDRYAGAAPLLSKSAITPARRRRMLSRAARASAAAIGRGRLNAIS